MMAKEPFSWFRLEKSAKEKLLKAIEHWEDKETSSKVLKEVLFEEDENLDLLIGAYRFFFYNQNYEMALMLALKIMGLLERDYDYLGNLKALKERLETNPDDVIARLYLNAYIAYAYVNIRLGMVDKAKNLLLSLSELDPFDQFGTQTMIRVLENSRNRDYEEDEEFY